MRKFIDKGKDQQKKVFEFKSTQAKNIEGIYKFKMGLKIKKWEEFRVFECIGLTEKNKSLIVCRFAQSILCCEAFGEDLNSKLRFKFWA